MPEDQVKLAPGETAAEWANGSPITRGEFDALLKPTGLFEIVEASAVLV